MKNRTLYFGDNLEILRKKIPDKTFDLIYLDPPFNSNRNYNVLFKEGLQDSPAQVQAFEDSWHWNEDSKHTFDHLVTKSTGDISNLMQALEKMIGHNDMLAYLTMMTVRLIELHRVLKNTGSIYLHCDPTASHYLKVVMDAIFGKKNFRNEIIWFYKTGGASKDHFSKKHDTIFFYTKTEDYFFCPQKEKSYMMHEYGFKKSEFFKDEKGQYTFVLMKDVWEIPSVGSADKQRLGFPTQKPEALLERIIKASSKEGDLILDPFCGCGTTVSVAERLKRNWVGIDITTLAINLIKRRLRDQFGLGVKQIITDGLPTDLAAAKEMFTKDAFQFEYWALDLINAMPGPSKSKENMRGADKGIDGIVTFYKGATNGKTEYGKAIVQVKGGATHRNDIATLKGDVEREKADCGIFITLEAPTKPMIQEAVDAGSFSVMFSDKFEFPKIQTLTVEELLKGKQPNLPYGLVKNYHKEAKAVEEDNNIRQNNLNI